MSARTASLGMYDLPAVAAANDALWQAIAGRLRAAGVADVPDALDRARPLDAIWDDPRLLLAQTCGYPLATRWRGRLRYIATPCYAAPHCRGASYRSLFVARRDDPAAGLAGFRGRIAAINDRASHSGANLLRAAVAPLAGGRPFFAEVVETGSHAASVAAVAGGRADIAAIDAVTFALLGRDADGPAGALRIVDRSASSPGLPFVTAAGTTDGQVAAIREALAGAIADPALSPARDALLIAGLEVLPDDAYDAVLAVEATAVDAGYPVLA